MIDDTQMRRRPFSDVETRFCAAEYGPSRAEETALYRHAILGDLLARDLERGELRDELKASSQLRYRPPDFNASRYFNWKTLQSWNYMAKEASTR